MWVFILLEGILDPGVLHVYLRYNHNLKLTQFEADGVDGT